MKKYYLVICLLLMSVMMHAQANFETRASGGWGAASTWTVVSGSDGDGIPDIDDNVTVLASHTVTLLGGGANSSSKSLTINSGGVIKGNNGKIVLKGNFTNNGLVIQNVNIVVQANCLFSSATTFTNSGQIRVTGGTLTIAAGTVIRKRGDISLQISGTHIVNNGSITLLPGSPVGKISGVTGTSWTNASGSFLSIPVDITASSTFDFSAPTNTMVYAGTASTIKDVVYSNLSITSTGAKTLSNHLTVKESFTLSSASSTLNMNGFNMSVGGNFTHASGLIDFASDESKIIFNNSSSATQVVGGAALTQFYDVEINNPGGSVSFTNTKNIINSLIMTDGNCNSNSKRLVLLSNENTTARIAPITNTATVSFSGDMVIQKYLPEILGGDIGYFYHGLASPVQNTTINDWDDELYMSGIGTYDGIGGPAGVDGDVYNGYNSVMTYNEPDDTWDAVTGSSTTLTPGVGYCVLLLDEIDGVDYSFYEKVINTVGQPNYGDVTVPVTLEGVYGSNLIGNPYASPITLSTGITEDAGVYSLYFMNEGDWEMGDLSTTVIPPHQAFFVDVANSGSIIFTEDCKIEDNTSDYHRQKPKYDIKLNLSSSVIARHHETRICFNELASKSFDKKLDARYIPSPIKSAPAIYTIDEMNNTKMLNNMINEAEDELAIPLGIFMPKAGVYYINSSVVNLGNYNYAWIENKKTGVKYDLNNDIAIEGNNAETNTDYVLHLTKKRTTSSVEPAIISSDLIIFSSENTINFKSSFTDYQLTQVLIYDMSGKLVLETNNMSIIANQISTIDVSGLANGLYIVKAVDNLGNVKTSKLYK